MVATEEVTGRVILLNGPPSSGKTTIAHALWKVLEPPHWYRSWDDFREGYLPRHLDSARGPWSQMHQRPLFQMLSDGYRGAIRAMALAGHNLISESIILPANIDAYLAALDGIPVFLVGVRCTLDVAEQRESARAPTERQKGVPIDLRVPEFELVHSHGAYDVEVDTSASTVSDAVERIQAALAAPPSPSAFERIRADRRGDG
jgi:chloramphenicol 3-O phosphotransferase